MKVSSVAEPLYWGLVLLTFLWLFAQPILDGRLHHAYPVMYLAGDAFQHHAVSQAVVAEGVYAADPPSLHYNVDGVAPIQPPLWYYLTALFSTATGLPLHDSQFFLAGLALFLSLVLAFLLVSLYHPSVAYLALPFMAFIFLTPFLFVLYWGFFGVMLGMLFLFASLVVFFDVNSSLLLGLFLAAIFLSHASEFFYLLAFALAAFSILYLLNVQEEIWVRRGLAALGVMLPLTLPYLPIFLSVYAVGEAEVSVPFLAVTDAFRNASVYLGHFSWARYVLYAGLLLAGVFFVREKDAKKKALLLFPLLIFAFSFLNWVGVSRIFQLRFYWPLLLSLPVGLVLSLPFKKDARRHVPVLVCSLLLLGAVGIGATTLAKPVQLFDSLLYGEAQWQTFQWLQDTVPAGSEVLFFYFEPSVEPRALWLAGHMPYIIPRVSLQDLARDRTLVGVPTQVVGSGLRTNLVQTGWLRFEDLQTGLSRVVLRPLCAFDYIYFHRQYSLLRTPDADYVVRESEGLLKQDLAEYSVGVANALLESGLFSVAFQTEVDTVLQNVGGRCSEVAKEI